MFNMKLALLLRQVALIGTPYQNRFEMSTASRRSRQVLVLFQCWGDCM